METPANPASLFWRILRLAPVRIAVLTGIMFYLYLSGHMFRGAFSQGWWWADLGIVLGMALLTWCVYAAFVRKVEDREPTELSSTGMGREIGFGALMGAGLYTLCVLILMALGMYRVDGFNSPAILLATLFSFGVLLRLVSWHVSGASAARAVRSS